MRKTCLSAVLTGCVVTPMVAHGEDPAVPYSLTANITLASEYIYRGIAQSNHKPAIQGGLDFAHNSGIYIGTWASSISWLSDAGGGAVSSSMEWDFYGGYKGTIAEDFSYDVGVLEYYYPGDYPNDFTSPNTTELYIAGGWKTISLKYSYALTNLFGAKTPRGDKTDGSWYIDLTGTYPLPEGFGLYGHVGYQSVKRFDDASYTDWKVGVTKDLLGFSFGLFYVGTNAKGDPGEFYRSAYDKDLGADRVLFTVSKTL